MFTPFLIKHARIYILLLYINALFRFERVKNVFVYTLNRLKRDMALIMVLTIAPLEPEWNFSNQTDEKIEQKTHINSLGR